MNADSNDDADLNWTEYASLATRLSAEIAVVNGRARALVNAIAKRSSLDQMLLAQVSSHLLTATTMVERMEELIEEIRP